MKFNPLPAICLCLVAACSPLGAQDNTSNDPKVTLRLDIVAWGNDIPGLLVGKSPGSTPITALAFRYATPVRYAGPRAVEIFQDPAEVRKHEEKLQSQAADIDDQGMPAPRPPARLPAQAGGDTPRLVARATLPTGSTRVTMLLAPGKDGQFQAHVIDDDPSKLPMGKLRVHNFSGIPVAVRMNGGDIKEIPAGRPMVFAPDDGVLIYELAYQRDGQWVMQENNMLRVAPSEQAQMILLKSDADFFANSDGSRGGYLQSVTLRRAKE